MYIQVVDNIERKTASLLIPAIATAEDVRLAVAFVSSDGLAQIRPSIQTALTAEASVEFLVGMDLRATEPEAIRELYALCSQTPRATLLCFVPKEVASLYHPKMYLARDKRTATAIIGSSNLTRRGLLRNIEANVVIQDEVSAEIISEIYGVYMRLKYHPDRVIPDEEFLALFAEMHRREKTQEKRLARDPALQGLRYAFYRKARALQRPKPTKMDLFGWLELVYEALPSGEFTNQDVYAQEETFRERYPQNLNIRAKIRQQLQVLRDLGFVEHVGRGVWRKIE